MINFMAFHPQVAQATFLRIVTGHDPAEYQIKVEALRRAIREVLEERLKELSKK